ncbi:preprotein translocase subunit SecE [Candidatus Jorgensenbacteria bacterium RIFCSPLOWO2_12_FULL_42_11]|uniref:Protein translocase subunit SecE n=1 Tax=Candidatus Jorgensenbacteria bacterium RIFCSPLOWO2_12_FULL_42_11 TaxID=1798473 RepID=A0A1F6C3W7_9BACT|nr:MAG: preprotein translocase subunit SecE [Candidatus Jorgensenbacteria bacterium RIFCSPLOWO2_12_FULL_42_11]
MFTKIKNFLQEARQEFKRINWPTRQETIRYTVFVFGFSAAMAFFLGLLDFAFLYLLKKFFIKF